MKINSAASNVPLSGPESTEKRESTPIVQPQTPQHRESTLNQAIDQAVHLFDHVISAMKGPDSGSGSKDIQKAKDNLGDNDKDLQSQDKLGNFQIQNLMSEFNESQQTISKVLKKEEETASNVIQNLK